jgi:hypothetical protein
MPRARKKPIEIQYEVFTGSNFDELAVKTVGCFRSGPGGFYGEVYDELHDTWIKVYPGQVIIQGTQGEWYPHAIPLFYENYDLL